jgi:hypothetical protein
MRRITFLFLLLAIYLSACGSPEMLPTEPPVEAPDEAPVETPLDAPAALPTETPSVASSEPDQDVATPTSVEPADESSQPIELQPLPTQEGSQMPLPVLPVAPSGQLSSLIEQAKKDLAQRLSISSDQISVVLAREVVWPDSSLGCPKPGMMYMMVLTPGYQIILHAGARDYAYHAGANSAAFYCENPSPPSSSQPVDN